MEIIAPKPNTIPTQLMPMGLVPNDPSPDHKCTYSAEARCVIKTLRCAQPPASYKPKIGISSAPAQIKKNCSTSLKIADRNPPSAT